MAHHQQEFVEVPEDCDMNMNDVNSERRDLNHYTETFDPSFPIDNSGDDNKSAAPTIKPLERQLAAAKKELSANEELLAAQDTQIRAFEACKEDQACLYLAALEKITRLSPEGASSNMTRYIQPTNLATYWSNQVSLKQARASSLEAQAAKVEEDIIAAMNQLRDLTSRVNTMQLQLDVEQLNVEHNQNKVVFQRGSQANIIINLAPGQTYTTLDGAILAYPTPSPTSAIGPAFGQATPHGLRHLAMRPDMTPVQQRIAPEVSGTMSPSRSTFRRRPNAPITDHVLQDASRVTKYGGFKLPMRPGTALARRYVYLTVIFTSIQPINSIIVRSWIRRWLHKVQPSQRRRPWLSTATGATASLVAAVPASMPTTTSSLTMVPTSLMLCPSIVRGSTKLVEARFWVA